MYQIEYAGKQLTVKTRTEAVTRAQELTRENGGRAVVSDENGHVRMVYRGGVLDSFLYESPVTRSKKSSN